MTYILSWNVQGIKAGLFDDLLGRVSAERQWDFLLLQEAVWTRSTRSYVFESSDGHMVFSMTPQVGQRSCAIVVNVKARYLIVDGSFQQHGRACSLDVILNPSPTRLVCCHLWAKAGLAKYCQSLSDVEAVIQTMPKNSELMIGADVNDKLGFHDALLFPLQMLVFSLTVLGAPKGAWRFHCLLRICN